MKILLKNDNKRYDSGFTLLELIAVLGIIGVISLLGMPAFQEWNAKRTFDRAVSQLYSAISQARLEALSRNITTQISVSRNGDDYNIIIAFNNGGAITTCPANNGGTWTTIGTETIELNSTFEITGGGIGDICFYRDGIASDDGPYNIVQQDGGTDLGNATISIMLATGFIDVIRN